MRAYVPAYDLKNAASLDEAFALLAGGYRPFAGGTDLMVVFETGRLEHKQFVSLHRLQQLRYIREASDSVELGALTTFSDVIGQPVLQAEFPSLVTAARLTGARAIQNRGTLGGNIANASPAADSSPALLAYDASVQLTSAQGSRWVRYAEFHLGYKKTALAPGELITAIKLPRTPGLRHYYRKVGTRRAQAISKVCVAAAFTADLSYCAIGLGSVGPTPMPAPHTIDALRRGQPLAPAVARDIAPMDDVRSTRDYRLRVAQNLIEDCFGAVVSRQAP